MPTEDALGPMPALLRGWDEFRAQVFGDDADLPPAHHLCFMAGASVLVELVREAAQRDQATQAFNDLAQECDAFRLAVGTLAEKLERERARAWAKAKPRPGEARH